MRNKINWTAREREERRLIEKLHAGRINYATYRKRMTALAVL